MDKDYFNVKPSAFLTRETHADVFKHYIGESLPNPSVINNIGAASLGTSPIPAREDHVHGYIRSGIILTDAAQIITTALLTDITWGTEVYDPDGWTSGGSALITVPTGKAGQYLMCFTGTWTAVAAAVGIAVCIYINGTLTYSSTDVNLVGVSTVTAMRTLIVGDVIKCVVYHNAGANKNIDSRFEIGLIGA